MEMKPSSNEEEEGVEEAFGLRWVELMALLNTSLPLSTCLSPFSSDSNSSVNSHQP